MEPGRKLMLKSTSCGPSSAGPPPKRSVCCNVSTLRRSSASVPGAKACGYHSSRKLDLADALRTGLPAASTPSKTRLPRSLRPARGNLLVKSRAPVMRKRCDVRKTLPGLTVL